MKEKPFYVSNKDLLAEYIKWNDEIKAAIESDKPEPPIPATIVDAMMKISKKLLYRPNFIGYSYHDAMLSDALYDCVRFAKSFNPGKKIYKVTFADIQGTVNVKDIITCKSTELTAKIAYYQPLSGLSSLKPSRPEDFNVNDIVESSSGGTARIAQVNSHYANNPFSFLTTIAFNAFLRRIDQEKMESYVRSEMISKTPMSEFLNSQNQDDEEFVNSYVEFLRDTGYNENHLPQSIKKSNAKKRAKMLEMMNLPELDNPFEEFEEDLHQELHHE